MKKPFLVLLLTLVVALPLMAQAKPEPVSPPPSTEQVMKFFQIMHIREQTQTLLQAEQGQIKVVAADMLRKKSPDATPAQKAKFEEFMDATMSSLFRDYPIDDILRDMVPVYQNHLTEADLNAVIAFYSSPVGQKLLREMPAMTSEAMRVSYTRLQPKLEEMMKTMDTQIEKMKEDEGGTKAKTAPENAPPKK